jgi:hypothetical protein
MTALPPNPSRNADVPNAGLRPKFARAFRALVVVAVGGVGATIGLSALATSFAQAAQSAQSNSESAAGNRYDTEFARVAGLWLQRVMVGCSETNSGKDLAPFTVVVRVSQSGLPEQVLAEPNSAFAKCVTPAFENAKYPPPPGPSWWVEMHIQAK